MSQEQEARAAYQRASQHDTHGEEAAAIPEYERALALGLHPDERCQALLGLGSSLRNVGRHEEAVRVLRAAVAEFPEHAALKAFLALALHSYGEGRQAIVALLDLTLRYVPLSGYARALGEYRDLLARPPVAAEGWDHLAGSLTRREFVATFPFPFLLEIGGRLRAKASLLDADDVTEVGKHVEPVESWPAPASAAPPGNDPFVLAVRKVATAVPSAVTLGRASTNDVVVRDGCVSKVHCFFRWIDGRWELADAGSRNGTWIGGRRLDGKGEPAPVRSGDVLSFGRAAFFFLDAAGLWDRLRNKTPAQPRP
jgi:tetratricopeptide (TPR) repeat protein